MTGAKQNPASPASENGAQKSALDRAASEIAHCDSPAKGDRYDEMVIRAENSGGHVISVNDGRHLIGTIIEIGRTSHAFDADDHPIGRFPNRKAAGVAISERHKGGPAPSH